MRNVASWMRPSATFQSAFLFSVLFVACASTSAPSGPLDAANDATLGPLDAATDATLGTCSTNTECVARLPPTTPADCASATCDAIRGCVFAAKDEDGDGHSAANCMSTNGVAVQAGDDCNDHDKNLYPGHPEACNGSTDAGAAPAGFCTGEVTCNADGTVSPCMPTLTCNVLESCVNGACRAGCDINGTPFAASAPNPGNACQSCQPTASTSAWTTAADGATCGNGQRCSGGQCGTQCDIGGTVVATGTMNPGNPCQACTPGTTTTAWSDVANGASCGTGKICITGACTTSCYVAGAVYGSGQANPSNSCQSCQPGASTTKFSSIPDGTECQAGSCCSGQCACPLALASGQYPYAIAVDATSVYWANNGNGTVMKVPLGGGNPTTLATGNYPGGIAVDATNVYFTNQTVSATVVKVPIGGGTSTVLASGEYSPSGIAINATSVFWTYGSISEVPLGGGTPSTLFTVEPFVSSTSGIAVDSTSVYWTGDDDGSMTLIMKSPIGGGAPTTLFSAGQTQSLVVDSSNVYWTSGENPGTVMSVPHGGGTPTTLASGQASPGGIAIDATHVYWTNNTGGTVMKVPLGGGTPTTLASGQSSPSEIAVDATSVYWTDHAVSGAVMKAPK